MKYTFIVPVYNGEKYIDRCLKSLLNQTYKNFEIIIINDGSTDNSESILDDYQKKHSQIKVIHQKNKGLSASRNLGIKKAIGDYLLFVDVDDYISDQTLAFIETKVSKPWDLIKFNWTSNQKELDINLKEDKVSNGSDAISYLINKKEVFEMAVLYAYNKEYLEKINFSFKENRYHEDFGLIPITILKSTQILLTSKNLYYYDQDVIGSITKNDDYDKTLKKACDVLEFYKEVKKELLNLNIPNLEAVELLKSYNANAVLKKSKTLKKADKKIYNNKIVELKVLEDLYTKTFRAKLKKKYLKFLLKNAL